MLTFLFWNLNGKNLISSLAKLVVAHEVDILILAECIDPQNLVQSLNLIGREAQFHHVPSPLPKHRIQIFTSFPANFAMSFMEDTYYTMRRLTLPGRDEVLLVAAHLLSLREATEETLNEEAKFFANEIRRVEAELDHSRTLVVGDLNLNPFSNGVVSAKGLHGVMTQGIARKEQRKIQGRVHPFFYNPMWRHLGDRVNSPPGTYYYRKSDHVCYFWNMFDQVLVRPALLDLWDEESLQILTGDGQQSFLTPSGFPNAKSFSDHLPLLFRLNL